MDERGVEISMQVRSRAAAYWVQNCVIGATFVQTAAQSAGKKVALERASRYGKLLEH